MRLWSLSRTLLAVSVLLGAATSADAAIISFTHVYDPDPDITLTVGGTEFHDFTHDLASAVPPLTIPPDQVIDGTLTIYLRDESGSEIVQFQFDLGGVWSDLNIGSSATFSFNLSDNIGGTVLIDSLNADGTLNVRVSVAQQSSGQASDFIFDKSVLSGRAEVGATGDPVPEPASLLLLGTGLFSSLVVRRARRRPRG